MKAQWAISTETVTPESAEDGEAASTDYTDGLTFREAFDAFTDADCVAETCNGHRLVVPYGSVRGDGYDAHRRFA